jgi:excisionase family DNA binding protein
MEESRLVPVTETARRLGVTRERVRQMILEGKLEAVRLGHFWYVRNGGRVRLRRVFTFLTHAGSAGKTSLARDLGYELGSSRDFCGFLFHGPKRVHVHVTPESPVLRGPQHHHRGQIHQAPLAGEDPNHPGPPLHLTDKPLQHIRALDVPLVAAGKVQVGQGLPQTLGKHLHRPLKPVLVTLNEPPGQRFRRAPPPRHKHLLELLGHHAPLRLRHMS